MTRRPTRHTLGGASPASPRLARPAAFSRLAVIGASALFVVGAARVTESAVAQPADPPPVDDRIEAPSKEFEPECIVHLTNGRRITGRLVARADSEVTVRIGEIPTTIKRAEIDRVEVLPPVLDRYAQMRAAIDDSDVSGLMVLVDWLRVRQCYTEALVELDHILRVDPGNAKAREQRKLIEQLRVIATPPARPDPQANPAPAPRPARPPRPEFPLLSVDDINLIKVYETDLAKPPRMRIDRETIEELIAAYAQSDLIPTSKEGRDALLRQSPERILDLMFRLRAREFYPRVKIIDQPESMQAFRESVHGAWLLNSCATDRCHGGADAGRLMLTNRSRNAEPALYTNFLILERFTLSDGTPLINYDQPQRSPLLHLGLPRERSLYPHSQSGAARGWKPVFTSQRDRRYEQALDWIRSMYRPRPEYPVTYTPPQGRTLLDADEPEQRDKPLSRDEEPGAVEPEPPQPATADPADESPPPSPPSSPEATPRPPR